MQFTVSTARSKLWSHFSIEETGDWTHEVTSPAFRAGKWSALEPGLRPLRYRHRRQSMADFFRSGVAAALPPA